jgi:predicted DNA-binding protein (UPF0251 family)
MRSALGKSKKDAMPRKRPNDDLMLEAARLYYEGGLDQAQVAKQIQVSRSYVSRLLRVCESILVRQARCNGNLFVIYSAHKESSCASRKH